MSGIYWLASYPKSGNTWLRVLLTNYLRNSDEPADINGLDIRAAGFLRSYFDEVVGIDSSDLTTKQIDYYRPLVYEKMAKESSENLFLKIHDMFEFNADKEPLFPAIATAGVIYLIRNPLDVVVSYAHHRDRTIDETISFMACNRAFLDGTDKNSGHLLQNMSSWSNHVRSWVDESDLNVLVVRYEDMIKDTAEVLKEIVAFANLDFDAEQIQKAVKFSRFDELKKQENAHGFKEKQPTAASFFRQGKSGTWQNKLTGIQIAQTVSDHRDVMRRFGYLSENDEILC